MATKPNSRWKIELSRAHALTQALQSAQQRLAAASAAAADARTEAQRADDRCVALEAERQRARNAAQSEVHFGTGRRVSVLT